MGRGKKQKRSRIKISYENGQVHISQNLVPSYYFMNAVALGLVELEYALGESLEDFTVLELSKTTLRVASRSFKEGERLEDLVDRLKVYLKANRWIVDRAEYVARSTRTNPLRIVEDGWVDSSSLSANLCPEAAVVWRFGGKVQLAEFEDEEKPFGNLLQRIASLGASVFSSTYIIERKKGKKKEENRYIFVPILGGGDKGTEIFLLREGSTLVNLSRELSNVDLSSTALSTLISMRGEWSRFLQRGFFSLVITKRDSQLQIRYFSTYPGRVFRRMSVVRSDYSGARYISDLDDLSTSKEVAKSQHSNRILEGVFRSLALPNVRDRRKAFYDHLREVYSVSLAASDHVVHKARGIGRYVIQVLKRQDLIWEV